MGNVLVSGNGVDRPQGFVTALVIDIIVTVLCLMMGWFCIVMGFAFLMGIVNVRRDAVGELFMIFMMGGGIAIVTAIPVAVNRLITHSLVGKTEINVCENGIKGTHLPRKFHNAIVKNYSAQAFSFTFEQITSIETLENYGVILNIQGKETVIYAKNYREIAEAINNRIQNLRNSGQNVPSA